MEKCPIQMWKQVGQCLLRPVRADQAEQTGLSKRARERKTLLLSVSLFA